MDMTMANCREIMANREILLSKINPEELKTIKNENISKIQRNLNYFVISSEIPTAQKLYILKRLNYMMSDDYNGLAVANIGLYEYETVSNTIAVTLLRAVGEMGDWGVFPTELSQQQKKLTLE